MDRGKHWELKTWLQNNWYSRIAGHWRKWVLNLQARPQACVYLASHSRFADVEKDLEFGAQQNFWIQHHKFFFATFTWCHRSRNRGDYVKSHHFTFASLKLRGHFGWPGLGKDGTGGIPKLRLTKLRGSEKNWRSGAFLTWFIPVFKMSGMGKHLRSWRRHSLKATWKWHHVYIYI